MAHKKGQGSTQNNRDSIGRRLGVKKCGGIVLNAVKFKLVLRMFAVIKRGTPYVETDAYKN